MILFAMQEKEAKLKRETGPLGLGRHSSLDSFDGSQSSQSSGVLQPPTPLLAQKTSLHNSPIVNSRAATGTVGLEPVDATQETHPATSLSEAAQLPTPSRTPESPNEQVRKEFSPAAEDLSFDLDLKLCSVALMMHAQDSAAAECDWQPPV